MKIGRIDHLASTLSHEYHVYQRTAGSLGISPVRWYGKEGYHEVIVLDNLGASLSELISAQQFDNRKTFHIAAQMVRLFLNMQDFTELFPQLSIIESLHSRHYIHCDIKPANFMTRVGDSGDPSVFLIDLGLARLFRDPATYLHIPYSMDHLTIGTLPFMSINCQQGRAQSRRDDLESLTYTIICLARGNLPWAGLSNPEAVLQKKLSCTAEELCEDLPAPFCKFINHVRALAFDEKPAYQYLHSILVELQRSHTKSDQSGNAIHSCTPTARQSSIKLESTPAFSNQM
jgi:serine/threonine protein kinase